MTLTEEQAQEMLDQLKEHYHEPVMPISKYCNAFYKWREAVRDGAQREKAEGQPKSLEDMIDRVDAVCLDVTKSNLLARLLYDGEDVRKEMCPEHKGHWAGCIFVEDPSKSCGCMSGYNVTGWLAPKP